MKPHVSIIDDDLSFGASLKRLLNALGISADSFPSARSFLDAVPPDRDGEIAVVDVQMPEVDGFSLMDIMRTRGYRTPVIMITGQEKATTGQLALEKGAIGFLAKPLDEQALLTLIEASPAPADRKGREDLQEHGQVTASGNKGGAGK